ncbi:MAG: carbamoyl-phosphate synthase large subunit [Candidatus Adiutrix sp.]|jgi:carbamoyl-phosphate synthase large subunit|nr:carbamoyl-phosphate synthase large subunit [Candidatus Adiutrix sp.]
MSQTLSAQVVLKGLRFQGRGVSMAGQGAGEVVVIAETADYQGALCDPAIAGKIAVMTYPHIGNTGWQKLEGRVQAAAVLMAFYEDFKGPSGLTLAEALIRDQVPAVTGLDTRAIAKAVTEHAPVAAFSIGGDAPDALLAEALKKAPASANTWYKIPASPAVKPASGKRLDLKKILIVGSGPIVIGQACEFDYSGVQAAKTLRAEGYEVILINSNPATIMTDPGLADQTYIEPLKPEYVEAVIAKERPQAILATMGGQTALNMAMTLAESGVLEKYGVEIIGADYETIKRAENRDSFRETVVKAGLSIPQSGVVKSMEEAKKLAAEIGFPVIIRPSFTLGGAGGGVAWNQEDLADIVELGLSLSLNHEVLLEKSVIGWKELEVEVLCDQTGRVVTVCTIENIDPMGVHTGDSITVAPAQTLSGAEMDLLIKQSQDAARALGLRNSGCNLQFALDPGSGELLIIEVNPRVSRSSALASKATGVPIAKISSLLAVGYNLDEIMLEMTGEPVAAAPVVIDYVAVKIPRWNFEKFPGATDELTTSMRSVGEVMSLGRGFTEALQKGFRSLETTAKALLGDPRNPALAAPLDRDLLERKLRVPNSERLLYLTQAMRQGWSVEEIFEITRITPWFLNKSNPWSKPRRS